MTQANARSSDQRGLQDVIRNRRRLILSTVIYIWVVVILNALWLKFPNIFSAEFVAVIDIVSALLITIALGVLVIGLIASRDLMRSDSLRGYSFKSVVSFCLAVAVYNLMIFGLFRVRVKGWEAPFANIPLVYGWFIARGWAIGRLNQRHRPT